jgi:hypothetical protein
MVGSARNTGSGIDRETSRRLSRRRLQQTSRRQLVAVEQTSYLASHPGFIDGVAEQYRTALKPLPSFLPQK